MNPTTWPRAAKGVAAFGANKSPRQVSDNQGRPEVPEKGEEKSECLI